MEKGYQLSDLPADLSPAILSLRTAVAKDLLSIQDITSHIDHRSTGQTYSILNGMFKPNGNILKKLEQLATRFGKPAISPQKATAADAVKKAIASQVQALAPLVDLVLSDAFTAEDREQIRAMVGNDGIFTLKNALARLCGERARTTL